MSWQNSSIWVVNIFHNLRNFTTVPIGMFCGYSLKWVLHSFLFFKYLPINILQLVVNTKVDNHKNHIYIGNSIPAKITNLS